MTISHSNAPAAGRRPTPSHFLLLGVLLLLGLYALIAGPAIRVAASEQLQKALADEDREVCGMFGARSGGEFATCSKALAAVRQKQIDRDDAAANGAP